MLQEPNENVSDRIKFLAEKFEKWKISIKEEPASSFHKEFIEVSEKLRDLLPKLEDSSLFKIDHILYPDQDWSDNDESKRMDNFKELCNKIDLESYLSVYFKIYTGEDGLENVLCDNVYLKVIKHMSLWDLTIKWTLEFLLNDKIPKAVCRGLKLMKIVLDTEYSERYQTLDLCYVMSRFRNIPTNHKNENKNKIALFIADLASVCYAKFEDGYKYEPNPDRPIESVKKLIINNIHHIIYMDELSDVIRNSLYEVFTFQEDQKTRKKYLKYFLRAITSSSCQVSFNSGFDILIKGILWNIIHVRSDRMDKEMRTIDKQCGYKIKSYLESADEINSMKLGDEVKSNNAEETDYIFEKFFFYDDVMKTLQLLNIFCTAYSMRHSLCVGEFDRSDYSRGFSEPSVLMDQLGFYLNNPELLVPWHIEKTLKIFPFMIFEFGQEDLVIDLINILRGKEILEIKEELSHKIERMKAIKSLHNIIRQGDVAKYPKR